ncbi:MAG TPA: dephospho-CoA kinase [Bacteroidales bacterium]|jgi:dephospho-CoA kinase|nr:dephospho-CoA kinase [Bacteroidales bacterium]HOL97519.1 dephospho-CoA kinase [Bacteroidales bacterium]HOM35787.1 dephospho-CoA kinase [Bacteroidales bacterium]HPD22995.1 dephospho-CoA kinase [Bacteroidales bacterium]HRS98834.1 dephospho-CoA kinase [Bacteroidales bacterium]
MIKIGLTGIIGSGKSTVSKIFETLQIPVYYSDLRASELINTNQYIIDSLKNKYGKTIYIDGTLNKPLLSSIIFNDNDERKFVNSVVHPIVINDFIFWSENQKAKIAAIESALIYETSLKTILTNIIEVRSPRKLLIERIIKRDKISKTEALKKINSQKALFTNEKPDFVIINDEKKSVILQMQRILTKIGHNEVW